MTTENEVLPGDKQADRYDACLSSGDWKASVTVLHLQADAVGRPKAIPANLDKILQLSAAWKGHVWYDEFLDRMMVRDGEPREWTDDDDYKAVAFLNLFVNMEKVTTPMVHHAVFNYARTFARRHAVRDWLHTLAWDSEPRIDHAFEDYWGVDLNENQPAEYVRAASKNFLVSLVARVMKPGCQVDTMPVFEGPQGARKSSALRVLGGEWYAQHSEAVTSKDFFQALAGTWLNEIGELDAFRGAEVTRVKTAISTPIDRYRPTYGRATTDHPRQCVFAGTTNKDDWGNDETGLRRFWPIRCGEINLTALRAAREQLFAEALVRFDAGETWWEMPASATAIQHARQYEHAWTEAILTNIEFRGEVTVRYILDDVLKLTYAQQSGGSVAWVIGRILTQAGWKKVNARRDGKQMKVWLNPAGLDTQEFS